MAVPSVWHGLQAVFAPVACVGDAHYLLEFKIFTWIPRLVSSVRPPLGTDVRPN